MIRINEILIIFEFTKQEYFIYCTGKTLLITWTQRSKTITKFWLLANSTIVHGGIRQKLVHLIEQLRKVKLRSSSSPSAAYLLRPKKKSQNKMINEQ